MYQILSAVYVQFVWHIQDVLDPLSMSCMVREPTFPINVLWKSPVWMIRDILQKKKSGEVAVQENSGKAAKLLAS